MSMSQMHVLWGRNVCWLIKLQRPHTFWKAYQSLRCQKVLEPSCMVGLLVPEFRNAVPADPSYPNTTRYPAVGVKSGSLPVMNSDVSPGTVQLISFFAISGNCHSPQLAMCRGVIPWDLTSVPSLPGITSLESLKEAMPYFELIIESGCSPRARQFLCSLLEPECMPLGSSVTPPCRTVCKGEYLHFLNFVEIEDL